MYILNGNDITLCRGDTFNTELVIMDGDEQYVPQASDVVKFVINRDLMTPDRARFVDAEPVLSVNVPISTMNVFMSATETAALTFMNYVYDIVLTHSGGIDTVIKGARLIALP